MQAKSGFGGFIKSYVTEEDFRTTVLPVMEKASLRSPEVALPGTLYLLLHAYIYKHSDSVVSYISHDLFLHLIHAKSY